MKSKKLWIFWAGMAILNFNGGCNSAQNTHPDIFLTQWSTHIYNKKNQFHDNEFARDSAYSIYLSNFFYKEISKIIVKEKDFKEGKINGIYVFKEKTFIVAIVSCQKGIGNMWYMLEYNDNSWNIWGEVFVSVE